MQIKLFAPAIMRLLHFPGAGWALEGIQIPAIARVTMSSSRLDFILALSGRAEGRPDRVAGAQPCHQRSTAPALESTLLAGSNGKAIRTKQALGKRRVSV